MIKWDWFWKLLRLSSIILLIGFFGFCLGSSVNADYLRNLVGSTYESEYDSSIDIRVLPKGSFLSTRLWIWKAVFAPRSFIDLTPNDQESYIFYIFWNDWKPYLYSYQRGWNGLHFEQWYLTQFRICDEIFVDSNSIIWNNNCIVNPITDGSVEIFKNFFSTVQAGDLYEYYYSNPNTTWSYPYWYLCVSSSDWWKSICFYGGCSPRSSNNLCQDLTGSLWLMPNLSLQDLNSIFLENPPSIENVNSSTGDLSWPVFNDNATFTGDYTYDICTYNEVISMAESMGYSKNLCYWGLDNFDNYVITWIYNPIPWTWKTLDEIYGYTKTNGQSLSEWFMYWRNIYQNKNVYTQTFRTDYPAVLQSYFKFYTDYNWQAFDYDSINEYCYLVNFSSQSDIAWESVYYWKAFSSYCSDSIHNQNLTNNWQYPNWTNFNWVWNLSWLVNYDNWVSFIQWMFNSLKENFNLSSDILWNNGFIPSYIIIFLLGIIIFKFLKY